MWILEIRVQRVTCPRVMGWINDVCTCITYVLHAPLLCSASYIVAVGGLGSYTADIVVV